MKYFRGSPTRALRGQPAWPGVFVRQRVGSLMVRALPRVDLAAGLDRCPFQVEGQAVMTDPFRAPLPAAARPATLDVQLAGPCPFPVRRVEPVGLRHRTR